VVVNQLAQVGPFRDLPLAALEDLSRQCSSAHYQAGEILYDSAEKVPPCVFLIVEGRVEVLQGQTKTSLVPVGRAGAGQLVGEFTALDGVRGHNLVRAIEATQSVTIPQDVFRGLIEQHPPVALNLLRDMIGIIRKLNDRIASFTGTHAEFERIRQDLFRFVA
jgi:CRP-like cAMP-binding protein